MINDIAMVQFTILVEWKKREVILICAFRNRNTFNSVSIKLVKGLIFSSFRCPPINHVILWFSEQESKADPICIF